MIVLVNVITQCEPCEGHSSSLLMGRNWACCEKVFPCFLVGRIYPGRSVGECLPGVPGGYGGGG